MRITREQLNRLDDMTVILNQDDKLAEGIEEQFQVVLKPLTKTEKTKLQIKCTDDKNMIDMASFNKYLFMSQVVSWTGLFEDENGQNIEADEDFKEKVYEYSMFSKYSNMIENKLLEINGIKVKNEEDIKKNAEDTLVEG